MPKQNKPQNNLSIILITIVTTIVTVVVIAILVAIQFSSQIGELFQGALRPMTVSTQSYQAPDGTVISDTTSATTTESVTPGATLDYLSMIQDMQNEITSLKQQVKILQNNNQNTTDIIQQIQSTTTKHTSQIEKLKQENTLTTRNIIRYFCEVTANTSEPNEIVNCIEYYYYLLEETGSSAS